DDHSERLLSHVDGLRHPAPQRRGCRQAGFSRPHKPGRCLTGNEMRDVYVIGAYTTTFKKHPGMSFGDLAREAYLGSLQDAGMKTGADIGSGWLGNCGMAFWGVTSIHCHEAL